MWPLLVPLVLQWTVISSLPFPEDVKGSLQATPACCPCPDADDGSSPRSSEDNVGEASSGFPAVLAGPDAPSSGCPCKLRDADLAAAPSFDLPRNVLPPQTALSQTNEDRKPLLHPEVDLASSVLETLREATDEEYREALARDVARSVARSSDDDTKTSPASIVTIILNPVDLDDDFLGQGTHIHESRCIHGPLGSARVANLKARPLPHLLRELLGMPVDTKRRNNLIMLDSGVAASNIREQFADSSNVHEVKVKPQPEFRAGPTTPKLPSLIDNIKEFTTKARANIEEAVKNMPKNSLPLRLRVDEVDQKSSPSNNAVESKDKAKNTQLRDDESSVDSIRDDNINVSSNVENSVILNEAKSVNGFKRVENPSSLPKIDLFDTPNPLFPKNAIDFRNAESISKSLLDNIGEKEIKIRVPYLKTKPLVKIEEAPKNNESPNVWKLPNISDLFKSKPETTIRPETTSETNSDPGTIISENNGFRTEIIDAFPSASEQQNIVVEPARSANSLEKQNSCEGLDNLEDLSHGPADRGIIESLPSNTIVKPAEPKEWNGKDKSNESVKNSEEINPSSESLEAERNLSSEISNVSANEDITDNIDPINNKDNISDTEQSENFKVKTFELSNIKENVVRKIDELQKQRNKIINSGTNIVSSKPHENSTECESSTEKDESGSLPNDRGKVSNPVTSKELQDMSDSLLNESRNRDVIVDPHCSESDTNKLTVQSAGESSINQKLSEEADSKSEEPIKNVSTESNSNDLVESTTNHNDEKIIKSSCDAQKLQSQASNVLSTKKASEMEMTAESSDAIPKTLTLPSLFDNSRLLGSRLMQSPIVQPTKLPDIESIFPLDLSEMLKSTPGLPTFEDLRSRLSELFGTSVRDDSGMDQDDYENVVSPLFSSSRGSSGPLALKRPTEEVDFDIFRLKPVKLSKSNLLKSKFPNRGLNMDSFKARLQVPTDAIKPLKMQSMKSFKGKDGNIFGAKLSMAPRIQPFSGLGSPRPNLLGDLSSRRANLLGESLPVLPNLGDIQNALDPKRILGSPSSLISEYQPLKLSEPLAQMDILRENFKADAKNAMNNLQQSVASSLSEAKLRHDNVVANTVALQPSEYIDNLEKARADLGDRLQSLHSDIAEKKKLPLFDTNALRINNDLPSLLQLPTFGELQTKQPKLVTSTAKTNKHHKQPKTSSNNMKQTSFPSLPKKEPGFRSSSVNSPKIRTSLEGYNIKSPLKTKTPTTTLRPRLAASDKKSMGTKVPKLNGTNRKSVTGPKDSSSVATDLMPSRLGLFTPKQSKFNDKLKPLRLTDDSFFKDNSKADGIRKLKPLITKPEVQISKLDLPKRKKKQFSESESKLKEPSPTQMRTSINDRKFNTAKTMLPDKSGNLRDTLKSQLSSPLKSVQDMVEGASKKQKSLIDLSKLSIANIKKPQDVVDDILTSARETLSSVNLNLPLRNPEEGLKLLKSPTEITEKLRSDLVDNLQQIAPLNVVKSKSVEIASPAEVLTNLRDTIKERFAEVDVAPLKALPDRRISDMIQGASDRLQNMAPPSTIIDSLRSSVNEKLSNFPQLKSVEELPRLNLLDGLKEPLVNIPSPGEVIENLRSSARDALSDLDLKPLPTLPELRSSGDLLPKLDLLNGLKDPLVGLPSPGEVIENMRSSARDALPHVDFLTKPHKPLPGLPDLRSSADLLPKLDLLDALKDPLVDIPSPGEVIDNLKSSARIAFSDLDLKPIQPFSGLPELRSSGDLLAGASDNLKAFLDSPAKSLSSDPVINQLRSNIRDRISDLNQQSPLQKNIKLSELRSNGEQKESVDDKRKTIKGIDALNPEAIVTKLRNSIQDKFPNIGLGKNRDVDQGASENIGTVITAPRKALKKNITYRCRMVCEEVEDD